MMLGSAQAVAREKFWGVKKVAQKGGDTLSLIHAKCEVNMPWHEVFLWDWCSFFDQKLARVR